MAPRTRKSTERLKTKSKLSLARAVELIASDQLRDTTRKPVRIYYKVCNEAAKILLQITSKDPNRGWLVLLGCDAMSLYGSQIPIAFNGYCGGEEEAFATFAFYRKEAMVRYVDKVMRDQEESEKSTDHR